MMKIEPTNVIDGKPVKEYVALPFGEFKNLARKKVDPFWGITGEMKPFKVTLQLNYIKEKTESEVIEIAAPDKETAEEMAVHQVKEELKKTGDYYEWDDIDISAVRSKKISLKGAA